MQNYSLAASSFARAAFLPKMGTQYAAPLRLDYFRWGCTLYTIAKAFFFVTIF